jgi:hypothetical protein
VWAMVHDYGQPLTAQAQKPIHDPDPNFTFMIYPRPLVHLIAIPEVARREMEFIWS